MTQTWTANVDDDCGNSAASVSVTYTWVEDTELPVITQTAGEDPDGTDLGCNPTVVAPTFSATDNCGVGSVTVNDRWAGRNIMCDDPNLDGECR